MTVPDIVGLISGLLAVFSFLTGVTSVRQLRRDTSGRQAGTAARRLEPKIVLWVSVPVFAVSMVVTLTAGLSGSDTGGAQFLLLVVGAGLLLLYATALNRKLPWPGFLALCLTSLGAGGLFMGIVSRGEEAEGLIAGLVIGMGIGLLGLAFRGTAAPKGPESHVSGQRVDAEREVLHAARQLGGELSLADAALNTSLSLDETRAVLEGLVNRGFCERRALPGGAVLYRFPDLGPR